MDNGVTGRSARSPNGGPAARSDYGRLAFAGLLLVIVIAGLRAGPALSTAGGWQGPWHDRGHGVALVAALELICAALLVALRVHARRAPHAGAVAAKLRLALPRFIVAVMIGVAASLTFLIRLGPIQRRRPQYPRATGPKLRHPGRLFVPTSAGNPEILKLVLLALIVIALAAAFLLLLRRQRSRESEAVLPPDEDDDGTALREAVAAGRIALGELSEPRMAIIQCYVAMERSLAEAGAARVAAETPDELLARSLAAGLLHGPAAAELTSLFYEARFSSHPVPPSARDRAERALDAISAELHAPGRTPEPAGSAATR